MTTLLERNGTAVAPSDTIESGEWSRASSINEGWQDMASLTSGWESAVLPEGRRQGGPETQLTPQAQDGPESQLTPLAPRVFEINDDDTAETSREALVAKGREILDQRRKDRRAKLESFKAAFKKPLGNLRERISGTVGRLEEGRAAHVARATRNKERAMLRKDARVDARRQRAEARQRRATQSEILLEEEHQSFIAGHQTRESIRGLKRELKSSERRKYLEMAEAKRGAEAVLQERRATYFEIVEQLTAGPDENADGMGLFAQRLGEELAHTGRELAEAKARLDEADKWLAEHAEVAREVQEIQGAIDLNKDRLLTLASEARQRRDARREARREALGDSKEAAKSTWEAIRDSVVGRGVKWLAVTARRLHQRKKA